MVIIDIPSVLELFPVVLEIEKETLLLVIVYGIHGLPATITGDFNLLIKQTANTAQDFA